MSRVGREGFTDFKSAIRREWLVTNGLGGFAYGTLGGTNTRRYHGLLIAALDPPGGRTLLVPGVGEQVDYGSQVVDLTTHEYQDGTVHPHGYRYIDSFHLDAHRPVWHFTIQDALLEKTVWMVQGENTTMLRYRVLRASRRLYLRLRPLCTWRDYHSHHHGQSPFHVETEERLLTIRPSICDTPYYLSSSKGTRRDRLPLLFDVPSMHGRCERSASR
ncbi:MAG: glycogen debranching enzyme N-terminal domain-containing protein [Bdellovibrionales bacterium]|nr:glycogen debranching enzyme N-terminal domain-containing protein [Bdellovibrionales bacterium]